MVYYDSVVPIITQPKQMLSYSQYTMHIVRIAATTILWYQTQGLIT